MRGTIFDYVNNLDTLIAVIVGACLATGGALIAEIVQDRLSRKRREREAARFFGEIISSIDQIFDLAMASKAIGDPWGTYTVGLFKVAAHESETYSRNRERLFDIHDMTLRFAVHGHLLRLTVPIANIVQESEQIEHLRARLEEEDHLSEAAAKSVLGRIENLEARREGGLNGAVAQREKSIDILAQLETIAGARFEAHY